MRNLYTGYVADLATGFADSSNRSSESLISFGIDQEWWIPKAVKFLTLSTRMEKLVKDVGIEKRLQIAYLDSLGIATLTMVPITKARED